MKTLTTMILKRWGFRRVLTVNALVTSAAVAAFGLFTAHTPHVVIVAVLLVSGCLRSLQFTALQAISFAEVSGASSMSQASSLTSMAQRLSQSLGVAAGAYALQLSSMLQGHAKIEAGDFWPAFVAMALISAASAWSHLRLAPHAGAEVSGHARF